MMVGEWDSDDWHVFYEVDQQKLDQTTKHEIVKVFVVVGVNLLRANRSGGMAEC